MPCGCVQENRRVEWISKNDAARLILSVKNDAFFKTHARAFWWSQSLHLFSLFEKRCKK
jgi:hypothetical protein